MFRYNGILVYSSGNELQDAFYTKVCQNRILTLAAEDISKSYISVESKLREYIDSVIPNIFIADDGFFSIQRYRSNQCFNVFRECFAEQGFELSFFRIMEEPTLQHCLCRDERENSSIASKALESRLNRGISLSIFYKEWVESLNVDRIVETNPIFADLAKVLYLT